MSTVINTLTTTRSANRLKLTDKGTFDKAAYRAYETVKAERDAFQKAEIVYKKRIDVLEKESADLLNSYEGIYSENSELRGKLDLDTDDVKEKQMQEEVVRLEAQISTLKTTNTMLQGDVLSLQKQIHSLADEKDKSGTVFAAERQLLLDRTTVLQKENNEMKFKINTQESENNTYMQQARTSDQRQVEINEKYKQVKRLIIKSENSNKHQKHVLEHELVDANSVKGEQQKEITNLKQTITKLQNDIKEMVSKNGTINQQLKKQNIELEIYKKQTSRLKSDVEENHSRSHELEDELKALEVKLDDTRYEGFEAVLKERTTLLCREKSLVKRAEILEHQVEEHLNSEKQLQKENEEYRLDLETAILQKQNSEFAEAAAKRKLQTMEQKYGLGRAVRRPPVKRPGTRVVVTMGDDQVERLENEKQELMNKLKSMEAENRKLEIYAIELENRFENSLNRSHYSVGSSKCKGQAPIIVEMKTLNTDQHPNGARRRSTHSFPHVNIFNTK